MIAAVTGATGHLGANLVPELLKEGVQVRALVHQTRIGLNNSDVEFIEGDVRQAESLNSLVKGAHVVYHLAASISLSMHDWTELETINVIGTSNIVQACLEAGVRRLVHFSSIHALMQEPLDLLLDESRSLVESASCPPYDLSKAAGEREVRKGIEQGLDAIIISPTAVIGPNDYRPSHFGEALIGIATGALPALIAGGFNWVDARDVVRGAILAEKKAPIGAKYLLSGHWASITELAAIVSEITGNPVPGLVCPAWLARAGAPVVSSFYRLAGKRPLFTSVSIRALSTCNRNISYNRANRDLGYSPRSLRETLVDTLDWFTQTGMLKHQSEREKGKGL